MFACVPNTADAPLLHACRGGAVPSGLGRGIPWFRCRMRATRPLHGGCENAVCAACANTRQTLEERRG